MRVWPNDVPYEQRADGANIPQTFAPPLSKKTESGVTIDRRRPGPRATTIAFRSVDWTEAQWDRFERFVREELLEGTLSFEMPVYRPNAGYVFRTCKIEGGLFNTDQNDHPILWVSFNLTIFNL